jgi:hypothetical protein
MSDVLDSDTSSQQNSATLLDKIRSKLSDIKYRLDPNRHKKTNIYLHVCRELDLIGVNKHDPIRDHILKIVEVFSSEEHSGSSASVTANILEKLLTFEPLSPLTGEDNEWTDVGHYGSLGVNNIFQNKRCGFVFKTISPEGIPDTYNVSGISFYKWEKDSNGKVYKNYFICSESRVPVVFPYIPTIEYREYKEWTSVCNKRNNKM